MGADVDADVSLGPVSINVDGLDDIAARVTVAPLTVDAGLDDVKIEARAWIKEIAPLFFNFLWKEIPLVKISVPTRYRLGFRVFGKQVFEITLCGETDVVTEPNCCDPCPQPQPSPSTAKQPKLESEE